MIAPCKDCTMDFPECCATAASNPRYRMLDEIYAEARSETLLGRPVMELPADKVMADAKGRVFVDLRLIIDQLQIFVLKDEK